MRRPVHFTTCTLALALLLIPLVGCASTSTQAETPAQESAPASPAPATSASPGAGNEPMAPPTYPPAPSDVSGMRGWFEAAYPETQWLKRIKAIEYVKGEVPESGGFANAIVITTDLDFKTELPLAQEIATALGEAHPTWAKQYVVWFADGDNMQAGDIFDMTP